MKKLLSMLVCAAGLGTLFGCDRKPVTVPVSSLSFPVLVIFAASTPSSTWRRAEICLTTEDLGLMRVDLFASRSSTMLSNPPTVLDSAANIFEMKEIKAGRSGLWMMINPQGLMPFSFTLVKHKDTGTNAAQALIAECEYIGRDLDNERRDLRATRIRQANTMAEIINIVEEMPSPK
jgi:hypothetical protein